MDLYELTLLPTIIKIRTICSGLSSIFISGMCLLSFQIMLRTVSQMSDARLSRGQFWEGYTSQIGMLVESLEMIFGKAAQFTFNFTHILLFAVILGVTEARVSSEYRATRKSM